MRKLGDTPLDAVARGLASGMSRRDALRAGGAAFVGAVAMTPSDAWAAVTGRCPSHRVKCHGTCCPKGEVCLPPKHKGGKRRCGCPAHKTRCGNTCVNLASDPHHCGHCHEKCTSGHSCLHGKCTRSGGCASGEVMCAGRCVTLAQQPANCTVPVVHAPRGRRASPVSARPNVRPDRPCVPARASPWRATRRTAERAGRPAARCVLERHLRLGVPGRGNQLLRRLREPVERRHPLRVVRDHMPKRGDVQQRHVRVPGGDLALRRGMPQSDEQPCACRTSAVNTEPALPEHATCANGT